MLALLCVTMAQCKDGGCIYSLHPLYTPQEIANEQGPVYTDETVVGKWLDPQGISYTVKEAPYRAYEIEWTAGEHPQTVRTKLRLVRLGKYSFVDLTPPSESKAKEVEFPTIHVDLFARLDLKGDIAILRFGADDKSKHTLETLQQTGKSKIDFAYAPGDDVILTSEPQKLREFMLEHAEDLFQLPVLYCRSTADCELELPKAEVEVSPEQSGPADRLALAYMRRNRFELASAAWRRPSGTRSGAETRELTEAFILWGHPDEAVAFWKKAESWKSESDLQGDLAFIYMEANQPRNALISLEKSRRHYARATAVVDEQMGGFAAAESELKREQETYKADPKYVDEWSRRVAALRGVAHYARGSYAAADEEFQKFERTPMPWRYFALRHTGKNRQAQQILKRSANASSKLDSLTCVLEELVGGPEPNMPLCSDASPLGPRGNTAVLGPIHKYLRGQIDEQTLIAQFKMAKGQMVSRELSLVYFTIAEKHLLDRHPKRARKYFQKTVDTNAATSAAWIVANARLKQMSAQ